MITRITFTKAKLKNSDDQTNIDRYRVAANITEYHIILKLIFPKNHHSKIHDDKAIISYKNVYKNVKN